MKAKLIAVGEHPPGWVADGFGRTHVSRSMTDLMADSETLLSRAQSWRMLSRSGLTD